MKSDTSGVKISSKINWLANHAPPGSLVLQPWLIENGISYSLASKYANSGWLKKVSNGVYYRPNPYQDSLPDWTDALTAITHQLNRHPHIAGLTSLKYQGLSHYLQLGKEQVWLGGESKNALPTWFREFACSPWLFIGTSKLAAQSEKDFTQITVQGKELRASSPELAAYEVVNAIGKHISFEHAAELFQGLTNLSPRKVQSILTRSKAVQTNRVFLFLSHYYHHQWTKRLDETQITLGTGKRQVVAQGRLESRYQITVPEPFFVASEIDHE